MLAVCVVEPFSPRRTPLCHLMQHLKFTHKKLFGFIFFVHLVIIIFVVVEFSCRICEATPSPHLPTNRKKKMKPNENENQITVACKTTKLFYSFIESEMILRCACNPFPFEKKNKI